MSSASKPWIGSINSKDFSKPSKVLSLTIGTKVFRTQPINQKSSKILIDSTTKNEGFQRYSKGMNLCDERWLSTIVRPRLWPTVCHLILTGWWFPCNIPLVFAGHFARLSLYRLFFCLHHYLLVWFCLYFQTMPVIVMIYQSVSHVLVSKY